MAVTVYSNLFNLICKCVGGMTFTRSSVESLVPVVARQSKRVTSSDALHPRSQSELMTDAVYHDAWGGELRAIHGQADIEEVSKEPTAKEIVPLPNRRRAG